MTRERFDYLFEQYNAGRLTAAEWEEWEQAFPRLMEEEGADPTWDTNVQSGIWESILDTRRQSALPDRHTVQKDAVSSKIITLRNNIISRKLIIRTTAAAAAIIIAFAGYLLFKPAPDKSIPASVTHSRNDIHPGGDRAILTLADGSRIVLDSARNGEIARQGMAAINKTNGSLQVSAVSAGAIPDGKETTPMSALVTTPRGGQYTVLLPDGSRVWLNSASSLRFPTTFKGRERRVELTGEGYFEIAKNPSMPFSVSIGKMDIKVLGTSFNAMAYADETTVNTTLIEGAVEVAEADLVTRLRPGQQSMLNSETHRLSVGQADIQQTIAWKNGLFEFDHTDLPGIMRQLARWYDIEVIYKVKPDHTPLGGSISKKLNLEEVLGLLQANGINHFNIEGKKVVVLP